MLQCFQLALSKISDEMGLWLFVTNSVTQYIPPKCVHYIWILILQI